MNKQPIYTIDLTPEPSDVPAIIRLRKALKCLLRSLGLRCLRIVEQETSATIAPPKDPNHDHH
jgi:hypothetical protein